MKEKRLSEKIHQASGEFADRVKNDSLGCYQLNDRLINWNQRGGTLIRMAKLPVTMVIGMVLGATSGALLAVGILPRAVANVTSKRN